MTNAIHSLSGPAYRERGAALFISLMFLIILTLIGLSAANVGIMQERMAGNVRETNVAFQGAEATLRNIETAVRASVQGTGGASLGVIPHWSELVSTNVIDHRSNCTLSQADPGDLPWQPASAPDHEFVIYRASDGEGPGGVFFGSACSPLVSGGEVPNKEFDNVHVLAVRAPTRAGGTNMETVQSIFSW